MEFGRMVFETCQQTDRQTDTLIWSHLLGSATRSEVTIIDRSVVAECADSLLYCYCYWCVYQRRGLFCWWVSVQWSVDCQSMTLLGCRWTSLCLSTLCTASVHSPTTSTPTSSTGLMHAPSLYVEPAMTAHMYASLSVRLQFFYFLLFTVRR